MPVGMVVLGASVAAGTAGAGIYAAHVQGDAADKSATLQSQAAANQLAYLKEQAAKAQEAADKASKLEQERYDQTWAEKMAEYDRSEASKAPYRAFGNNALATLGGMIYGPKGAGNLGRIPDGPSAPPYHPPIAGSTPPAVDGTTPAAPAATTPAAPVVPPPEANTLGALGRPTPAPNTPPSALAPGDASFVPTAPISPTSGVTLGDLGRQMVTVRDPNGRLVRVPARLAAMYQQLQSQPQPAA